MKKSFVHLAEAWYKGAVLEHRTDDLVDDVYLTLTEWEDSVWEVSAEFCVSWHKIDSQEYAKISLDSVDWWVFSYINDVLLYLSNNQDVTPEKFCEFLKTVDYVDETKMEY